MHTSLRLCVPESVSQSCVKFWQLYVGVNGDLLQQGLCHTQVCCTQSHCPCSRPLLTHISVGDTQTQFWLRLSGISGSWCTQGLFEPSERLWWVGGLILNMILPLLPSRRGFPFALGMGYLLKVVPVPGSRCPSTAQPPPQAYHQQRQNQQFAVCFSHEAKCVLHPTVEHMLRNGLFSTFIDYILTLDT